MEFDIGYASSVIKSEGLAVSSMIRVVEDESFEKAVADDKITRAEAEDFRREAWGLLAAVVATASEMESAAK